VMALASSAGGRVYAGTDCTGGAGRTGIDC